MSHALARTSRKPGPFYGTCIKCGATNLPPDAVDDPCPADTVMSDEAALVALMGEEPEPVATAPARRPLPPGWRDVPLDEVIGWLSNPTPTGDRP